MLQTFSWCSELFFIGCFQYRIEWDPCVGLCCKILSSSSESTFSIHVIHPHWHVCQHIPHMPCAVLSHAWLWLSKDSTWHPWTTLIILSVWNKWGLLKLAYTSSEKEAKFINTRRSHWELIVFCNLVFVERLQTLLHAYKRCAKFGIILGWMPSN